MERLQATYTSDRALPLKTEFKPLSESNDETEITTFYKVENDVFFLQKYAKELDPREKDYYLRENIYGLLAEFAGKLPYRNITYIFRNGGLCYGGIRMLEMLRFTSELTGEQSRETKENIGHSLVYTTLESDFNSGQNGQPIAILSPPKNWDYGYLFFYEPIFDPKLAKPIVKMHAIKYPENRYEIKNSQNILLRINPHLFYKSTDEFLSSPVFDFVQTPNMESILQAANISNEDIEYSRWFEKTIASDELIQFGMNQYANLALELSCQTNFDSQQLNSEKLNKMEFLLRGMYNRAKKIKEEYKDQISNNYRPQLLPNTYAPEIIKQSSYSNYMFMQFTHYASLPAIVQGGGSCPSVSRKSGKKYLSSSQLSEGLSSGKTIESQIAGNSSLDNDDEENYEYHTGNCAIPKPKCGKTNVDVGPCNICRECVKRIEAGEILD